MATLIRFRTVTLAGLASACALWTTTAVAALQESVVETMSGKVRGVVDGDVISFKGIPFAAPSVGELRWRAPQPPEPWEGVHDAIEFARHCQHDPYPEQGTFGAPVDAGHPVRPRSGHQVVWL